MKMKERIDFCPNLLQFFLALPVLVVIIEKGHQGISLSALQEQ